MNKDTLKQKLLELNTVDDDRWFQCDASSLLQWIEAELAEARKEGYRECLAAVDRVIAEFGDDPNAVLVMLEDFHSKPGVNY